MKKELGIFILLVVLCAVTGMENHHFFYQGNLTNNANLVGLYGILGIGVALTIITGGIDLSIGSIIALNGILLIMALTRWHWAWPFAILFALGVPTLLGLGHGFLITRFKLQPFIVTLCGLLIYRGLARYISDESTLGFGDAEGFKGLQNLCKGDFHGFPMSFIYLIAIAFLAWILLHRSIYGRYLFAIGRNEEATRFSGINTRWIVTVTYAIAGLLSGISGVLFAFWTNNVAPSIHGTSYELYGIAAAVLGGCSLRGGEGSIIGVLIGTAVLIVLQNLVNLLGIPSSLNNVVMGMVLLIGVLVDQILQMRTAKKNVRAKS